MPLTLTWEQIALRLLLASVASFFIGLNRDERGHPAGLRTTMLVCLAATFAMLQVNLLLPLAGRGASSFVMNDLMRLPLGILSGIGFIGAGVIVKRENRLVTGVTTAATMWYVTVLGLLFGGGEVRTGCAAALLAIFILWGLKRVESLLPRTHQGDLCLTFDASVTRDGASHSLFEEEFRRQLVDAGYSFSSWKTTYDPAAALTQVDCTLRWRERAFRCPHTPHTIEQLRGHPGVRALSWSEIAG